MEKLTHREMFSICSEICDKLIEAGLDRDTADDLGIEIGIKMADRLGVLQEPDDELDAMAELLCFLGEIL